VSATNAFENSILALFFNGTAIADLAEDDTSSPATTLTVSLHTGDPGEAGDMTTNEAAYTGYARQTVARTSGGWTVTGNSVSPNSNIDFPESSSSETITHIGIGTGTSDNLMFYGALDASISVVGGSTPRISTSTTITLD
jgi:hypothetical protein